MSVGETKGKQVEQLIKDKKPKVSRVLVSGIEAVADVQLILELGAYVGYSGVAFSRVSTLYILIEAS
jgi:catechol O-methyltransferase